MIVYRLCQENEIKKIIETKDFSFVGTLGKVYKKEKGEIDLNTHHYKETKRYMHFFPKLDNIFYLNPEKDMYVCYYDIPEELLNNCIGYGEYKDYFTLSIPRKILEYSIENNDLDFNYLEKVDKIIENIPVEEYFADENLTNFLETIYTKEKSKTI